VSLVYAGMLMIASEWPVYTDPARPPKRRPAPHALTMHGTQATGSVEQADILHAEAVTFWEQGDATGLGLRGMPAGPSPERVAMR
jgi:hypothetical protein